MNYYPHHIGDYARDTAHLSMLEDAAYRRMLDLYYASERPLPLNRAGLYRLVRAKSKPEQLAVDVVLGEFFLESEGGWRNSRADAEIAKAQEKSQSARTSAGKRWHSDGNAKAMRSHSDGNAPNNQEPKANTNNPQFETFWTAYPRKVAKHDAAKAFKKLALVNGDFEKVLSALDAAKASEQWQRDEGKFIPHASTWLNGRRFEDEGHTPPTIKVDV